MSGCSCCGKRHEGTGYRALLREPGTLFTLASGILLAVATVIDPGMLLHDTGTSSPGGFFYLVAALTGSAYIWYSAIRGIREGDFTSDIPVSLATLAAIAIGQYPAAAVVAVLLLTGGLLEDYVAARAGNAMEGLAALLPDRATVRRDGTDTRVPLGEVVPGEIVLVRSGERIPVDGYVLCGTASVNQAPITGESAAVEKQAGDTVYAGTFNECGALEIRTGKTGDSTLLGRIRELIDEAKEQKPPVERVLDRYARLYTPAALLLGAALWLWSGDLTRTITMLIVFCPCVIVLATPTALVAAIGNAARRGNLVKNGAAIESLASVDTVIFDKTGTLTEGKPALVSVIALTELPEGEILRMAACAEKFSEHPLGRAVTEEARRRTLPVPAPGSFAVFPGQGVRAVVGGEEVVIGNTAVLAGCGIAADRSAEKRVRERAGNAGTVTYMAVNGRIAAVLVFGDFLRPDAKNIVDRLQGAGVRCVIVTGDRRDAATRVGTTLGIAEVHAEVLPQDKVEIVRDMQKNGRRVAFVGDGVNDGPALAAADIGIAMGLSGTDIAIETADIALLSDDLAALPHLHALSRSTLLTIRNNLVFAVGVLVIAVLLTIPGILQPVTGALLHEFSSLPVIANSVRLIAYRTG